MDGGGGGVRGAHDISDFVAPKICCIYGLFCALGMPPGKLQKNITYHHYYFVIERFYVIIGMFICRMPPIPTPCVRATMMP